MTDDANNYKLSNVFLKEAEFKVLIIQIPESEIEDKLAYLAREKGHITKSLYEDFIIATCVANINQLLYHIGQQVANPPDLMKVREELIAVILDKNPKFDPDKLIINSNYVVKMKDGKLADDEKKLTDNKNWDTSYYDDITKLYGQQPAETPPTKAGDETPPPPKKGKSSGVKDVNKLPYEVKQKWWKRIGQYVPIKCFSADDVKTIFSKNFFHNRTSFGTYIVSICVENFEELFSLLDNMGIPSRVAPPILMNELYELCRSCNDFLTYENALDMSNEEPSEEEEDDGKRRTATSGSMSQFFKKKGKTKKFKDVSKKDLLKLADNMKVFLIGQDKAVDTMTEAIQRASIGLKDPNRPIGSFLFAGRTGVGKTLATKVLADELIRGRNNLVTIDCSEYSADHEYSKLIGAPSGYVGHEAGGVLTNAVMKAPFTIVVFDEVEKASRKVHELLLQILEEGRLTDGKGKAVSFKDTVVVLTSNVGVAEIDAINKTIGFGNVSKLTDTKKDRALKEALKKKFKPEFLNRIDAIVNFKNLTKKDYMRIIDIELYKLNDNLKSNDTDYKELELKFDDKVRKFVYKNGINEEYGARPLKRCIEKHISTPLARKLISEDTNVNSVVSITAIRGKTKFKMEQKISDAPFYMNEQYKTDAALELTGENN